MSIKHQEYKSKSIGQVNTQEIRLKKGPIPYPLKPSTTLLFKEELFSDYQDVK